VQQLVTNLVRHRFVLWNFIARDLKVKYRGTLLGYLWSLLEPLSLVVVYHFVFVVIARRGGDDYPLQVMLGVLPYGFLSAVIQGGSGALTSSASLIRRVYIPREVFVAAHVGSSLAVYLLSMLVVVPFAAWYDVVPGWRLLLLPLAVVMLTAFGTGVALVTACANAIYRDVGYTLRVLLRLLFYAAPVVYTVEMVPERMREVFLLNPVAVYVSMARNAVLDRPMPFDAARGALAAVVAVGTLAAGAAIFRRWERKAVKFL
jgi:ABC-type polysaccharide/polyol phosphate export permease